MNLKIMYAGLLLAATSLTSSPLFAQRSNALGQFDGQSDVGKVKRPGAATYDPVKQEYTVEGSGTNIWFDHDEFHYVWKHMKGDFILQLNGKLLGKGVDPHRKLGWMVRSTLDSNSAHINAVVHGDGLTSLQFRRTKAATTEEQKSALTSADVVQLARKGNTYTMSVARNGQLFVTEQVSDLTLGDDVYVGLFVCSHNPDVSEKAVFHNVRIIVPARNNFVPYREYIGSDLELMDVATGHRKAIYHSPESIQAPNWLPNNKALIYNSNGKLYRFDLKKKTPTVINTDFAINNNNDHVLSFDGKMIGISNHVKDEGNKSIVYTLPVGGGKPKRITPLGHSYLHGWSPDGKTLIYTGQRNDEFDIYKISSDGGPETQLTTAKGLDDGSEYSPDGKYIYFNSTRSGTMQIWRMKADGSDQTQITNDEFNNWFPHISPDGKWMTILSFGKDVSPDDHPFYKHVYLRLLPVSGDAPAKVIAYVYGGQGTINTPSWSPDSKQIAFISNSDSVDKAATANK
ncbi:TolB family protein [Spirosoma oryzicola]|uniref:TolB family protein n=1 Tax=Spirosoma oryzicola TaxID=2898794 RepID=UPI001E60CB87|nr:biopolymer transporter TolR [Spirosoma oryzicola]UHG90691.1 biopolymer transporter TolR [Spirosoma oryzicola]